MKSFFLLIALALYCAPIARGQELGLPPPLPPDHKTEAHSPATHNEDVKDSQPHPSLPQDPAWPRGMVIAILTLFALAAGVGTLARMSMPEEPAEPDAHGHDDHGHDDHGHGQQAHNDHADGHH